MFPSLTTILLAWGILVPAIMWGWWHVDAALAEREQVRAVAAAKAETIKAQTEVCNGRVATIESALAAKSLETAKLVQEADGRAEELRQQLTAAGADRVKLQAAIRDLCRRSATCRDRSKR